MHHTNLIENAIFLHRSSTALSMWVDDIYRPRGNIYNFAMPEGVWEYSRESLHSHLTLIEWGRAGCLSIRFTWEGSHGFVLSRQELC